MKSTTRRPRRHSQRVAAVLHREIGFVYNPTFERALPGTFEAGPLEMYWEEPTGERRATAAGHELNDGRLLTYAGERYLFRRMNFLKYRANVLRSGLDASRPERRALRLIDEVLSEAAALRNQLVQANLRLVKALARQFASAAADYEDLVGEGHVILMRAIDKFDYDRGFRFSTYATHAIRRHFLRWFGRRQRRRQKEVLAPDLVYVPCAPVGDGAAIDDESLRRLAELLGRWSECLSDREQLILRRRFGVGGLRRPQTLVEVSREVGLSKERVRQIQLEALQKLNEFASAAGLAVEL
jgi:RNA polymerase sigma factor (sigma-70 family)